jgi:hypothetical protein
MGPQPGEVRNPEGRGGFTKGHKRGGRPKRVTEEKYLRATLTCCPLRDWKAICRRAVALALEGDHRARQWLSTLIVGADPIALRGLAAQVEQVLAEVSGVSGSEGEAGPREAAHNNGEATVRGGSVG